MLLVIVTAASTFALGGPIPYLERYGIYSLEPETGEVKSICTSQLHITGLRVNSKGDQFVFAQRMGEDDASWEICTVGSDGEGFERLTENDYMDVYPAWSPNGERIAFLSWPGKTLDIYVMNSDGTNLGLLYDSGYHDADPNWVEGSIAFTSNFQIWVMDDDGTGAHNITDHPRAGEWGEAVLPFGDYDPRMSQNGEVVAFSRLVDDSSPHGNYDIYRVGVDGSGLAPLTETGYTQGFATWSHAGDRIAFIVSAVGSEGRYDIHVMETNGGNARDLTSGVFPPGFIAHCEVFSEDDSLIYFVGEWWGWEVIDSTISCDVQPGQVEEGGTVSVSGRIEPPVEGAHVTLNFIDPDDFHSVEVTTTDGEGSFEYIFEPPEAGYWSVESSWEGDAGHTASGSGEEVLQVQEMAEPDDGGGIPGFPWESLLMGLLLGIIVNEVLSSG